MGRTKGSKNKKKKGVNNEIIKQAIPRDIGANDSNIGISILDVTETIRPRAIPVLTYYINRSRTKGIEKRIASLVSRHKSFYLITDVLVEQSDYFIDSGGWAFAKLLIDNKYDKLIGHVKNLLPFLDGPHPVWEQKRSYQRHSVRRGIHLG